MTSIPASRSARAITFAPRSWPSSPGLAISTRIFFSGIWREEYFKTFRNGRSAVACGDWFNLSGNGGFVVDAEDRAQGVADFAERRVRLYGLVEVRHQVLAAGGR